MRLEPTVSPSTTIIDPFACDGKTTWAIAVTTTG
jgi:hypothetical protein